MILRNEIPELSHVETVHDFESLGQRPEEGTPFYVTLNQRVGIILCLPAIDLESFRREESLAVLSHLFLRLKAGVTLKFLVRAVPSKKYLFPTSRAKAIQQLGWIHHESFLIVETAPRLTIFKRLLATRGFRKTRCFEKEIQFLREALDWGALRSFGARVVAELEIPGFFPNLNSDWIHGPSGIETGVSHVGVLRLWRQGTVTNHWETLAGLREQFAAPYEIVMNLQKVPDVRSQFILQRKRGQKASSQDSLSMSGLEKTEKALEATLLSGQSLMEVEWLLILRRYSEKELKEDLEQCEQILSQLGDVIHEVQGATQSWLSAFPGTEPHHTFLELDPVAPYYCPILIRGEMPASEPVPAHALPLHRQDGSLYHFDLFRKGYDGANCIINGRRGRGKSVLANLISSGLLANPDVRLVKVDVGGSYIKECELNNGIHIPFNLSEPSGLNPFRLIQSADHVEDAAAILAAFLGTLILESKETTLSKELHGALERAVLSYANEMGDKASIDDFLNRTSSLPRKALLERFAKGGVFSNVLRERGGEDDCLANRYVYFNFERLQNAADEDFSQAVMAAVIASVNLAVLRAGDARRGAKHRIVFFADETPFFIQRNGRFFKLTTANFRKFGHGTVLIAQTTKDFELVKEGGDIDFGILVNSPIRFLFQIDDESPIFQERFNLTAKQIEDIRSLQKTDNYREVFLQDELGCRVLRVAVTPEEYWRVTSSRSDNEKLHTLLRAVPGLGLEEAIRCLSI